MNGASSEPVEDANRLLFPKGFEKAIPIFNDEVLKILTDRKSKIDGEAVGEHHAYFEKSFKYVSSFQRFPTEFVGYVRSLFDHEEKSGLRPFEIALLANLCPQSSKEAMALIPSLRENFRDAEEDLDAIVERLQQYLKTNL